MEKQNIERFDSKQDDEYVRHLTKKEKEIPTNYSSRYGDAVKILKDDCNYLQDPKNAEHLDHYDLGDIYRFILPKLQNLNNARVHIDLTHTLDPNVAAPSLFKDDHDSLVGLYFNHDEGDPATADELYQFLHGILEDLESHYYAIKDYNDHETFLYYHNHVKGRDMNKTVGVHIDNVVNDKSTY